ncbi:uncharacterized protein PAM68-like [Euphorbia lathyris]|uniref:uncharacterized protein PAM68-like n=1 Tax=Euphorbia lathyris TaxID=212925 RepID=UPI003313F5F1
MNSLILSQRSPFYLTGSSSPSPSPSKLHTNFLPTTPRNLTKWQQNANAKGFTSKKPPPIKQPKLEFEIPKIQNSGGEDEEEIPRDVFNRLILRVCVCVGVPMVLGYGFLSIFGALREQGYDVPKWMPFLSSFLTFGASCFGIPYGALSTSLDPDRKGSVLGFDEAQKHWVEMWEEEDKS